MNRIPGGLLIVIEGIDGAGKTTQAALIAQYFGQLGFPCVLSKEPTNRKWGQKLRESAKAGRLTVEEELQLFYNDRREHVEKVISPALADGLVVILDRYFYSTAAYQGPRGVDVQEILTAHEDFAPVPNLVLILDLPAKSGVERIVRRGDSPNKFESVEDLEKAREVFLSVAGQPQCRKINAEESIGEVHDNVIAAVQRVALEAITKEEGLTKAALNSTLKIFGGDPIEDPAEAGAVAS